MAEQMTVEQLVLDDAHFVLPPPRTQQPPPAPKDDRKPIRRAICRLMTVVGAGGPDMPTSRADARIALNIARGVPLDDIDPALGYDISERAYRHVRGLHARNLAEAPDNEWFIRYATDAHASWRRHRPDLAADDDWFALA